MDISFGNNGKTADLRLGWRNLERFELDGCPSQQQITDWIASGRISLHQPITGGIYPSQDLKKLTVTKARPVY